MQVSERSLIISRIDGDKLLTWEYSLCIRQLHSRGKNKAGLIGALIFIINQARHGYENLTACFHPLLSFPAGYYSQGILVSTNPLFEYLLGDAQHLPSSNRSAPVRHGSVQSF